MEHIDISRKAEPPKKAFSRLNSYFSFRRDYQLWLMVLPAILVIFIFNYIPMYGIQIAFRNFDFTKGFYGGKLVGFKYFEMFFKNYLFWNLIRNTIMICVTQIVVGFPAPILMALLFNQISNNRIKRTLQTTVYFPHFISTVALVSMMVVLFSPNTGIFGIFIRSLGFQKANLLGDTSSFVPMFVGSDIWQNCGWGSIIYFAALSSIDVQIYDSCKIDGASKLQTIWHIEIPHLVPTIIILFVLSMGNILNTGFEKVFLMQNVLNINVSEVISTYVYKIGITNYQYSYSAAIGLFNTVVNFIFLILTNMIARRNGDISLW